MKNIGIFPGVTSTKIGRSPSPGIGIEISLGELPPNEDSEIQNMENFTRLLIAINTFYV